MQLFDEVADELGRKERRDDQAFDKGLNGNGCAYTSQGQIAWTGLVGFPNFDLNWFGHARRYLHSK